MKKFKWVLLGVLIVSLVFTFTMFINFINKNNNDVVFKEIYNKDWYIMSLVVTDTEEVIFRNDSYSGKYIVLSENTIKLCDIYEDSCKVDNYIYENNIIYLSSQNTLGTGNYEIEFSDSTLILSTKEGGITTSYHLVEAKG